MELLTPYVRCRPRVSARSEGWEGTLDSLDAVERLPSKALNCRQDLISESAGKAVRRVGEDEH